MRFVPDGPVVPNDLIRKWRDGKVLFLAGAGVSRPAGLPLFKGLALDIYKQLNDGVHGALANGRDKGRRDRLLAAAALSAKQKVEGELFLDNQLDRLFAAMEARIDQDENGRLTQRQVRAALEVVLRRAKTFAQGHRDLLRLSVPLVDRLPPTTFSRTASRHSGLIAIVHAPRWNGHRPPCDRLWMSTRPQSNGSVRPCART
jgi:hypothetical protein